MNKTLYICLEGLDGSGKTTLYKSILPILKQKGYKVQGICPTQKMCPNNKIEKLFERYQYLYKSKFARMFLFAIRSNYAASNIDWSVDLLLGDRSIITSYICRWTRYDLYNRLLVFVTDMLNYKIPSPNYVIYLDVPPEVLQKRLSYRKKLDIDETDERSMDMRNAYEVLRKKRAIIKRIENTQWFVVDGNQSIDIVQKEVLQHVLFLLSERK